MFLSVIITSAVRNVPCAPHRVGALTSAFDLFTYAIRYMEWVRKTGSARSADYQNERPLFVLDYVGFTEAEYQAWLRNFRLSQRKNGKSLQRHSVDIFRDFKLL